MSEVESLSSREKSLLDLRRVATKPDTRAVWCPGDQAHECFQKKGDLYTILLNGEILLVGK